MPGGAANILTKLSVAVGGVLVSAANALPVVGGSDTTSVGTISASGSGSAVTIACDGRGAVTIGLSGTWVGTVVWEVSDGTSWWPMRAHLSSTVGVASAATQTTANATITIPCAGYAQVRVYASVLASGTITVQRRASASQRAIHILMSAMAPTNGVAPDTAVLVGAKDGSSNIQAFTFGQALAALCLPVVLPAAQDVLAQAAAATGANVPAQAVLSGFRDPSGKVQAALLSAANIIRVQQDYGLPAQGWSADVFTSLATTGRVVKASAGVFRFLYLFNNSGASQIPMLYNRTTANPSNGTTPQFQGTTIATGALANTNMVEGGMPFDTGMCLITSTTTGTLTQPASTAQWGVVLYG